jgi:hypothetical protein
MSAQREAAEAEIRTQVDKIVAGIRAKDLEALRPTSSPDAAQETSCAAACHGQLRRRRPYPADLMGIRT